MAETSLLNCLSCRTTYQSLHSLTALPLFSEKAFLFNDYALSHSLPQTQLQLNGLGLRAPWLGKPTIKLITETAAFSISRFDSGKFPTMPPGMNVEVLVSNCAT